MWPSLWRRPVPCNSPGRDTLWTPPRRQRDPCVAARGTPHDATGSGCLPNVGYWPRLVTIAVLDLGGVLCQQREGPGVRAAGQSSPLTPTPPFQAPPSPSFRASRGPKQRQRRLGSGPPTPLCAPLTPHAPVECPRRGEGLSYLGVRRLGGVPACEGRVVRVVARVQGSDRVLGPTSAPLHLVGCGRRGDRRRFPHAWGEHLARCLVLAAVLPDRLCLPLSLGGGKPGGSLDFLWSCRFLTPPTRPFPPPPLSLYHG